MESKEILKACVKKGFLLDKEVLEQFSNFSEEDIIEFIEKIGNLRLNEKVITKNVLKKNSSLIYPIFLNLSNKELSNKFLSNLEIVLEKKIIIRKEEQKVDNSKGVLKVISAPKFSAKKVEVQDFVKYFRLRYEQLQNILKEKSLENLKSLRRIGNDKESSFVIVMILDKRVTKTGNIIFEVEDLTGHSRVLINQNREEIYHKAKDILVDEVVAFKVSGNSEILFANDVLFPESNLPEKKKYSEEEYAVFTSDVHVGSTMFLESNFLKFLKWLNCEEGTDEQKNIAKKIKYLFLVGDNVDGVGVYPSQEKFLQISDMKLQYKKLTEYLKMIRPDIKIIMCPGQHDAVWVGEPQPIVEEIWSDELYKVSNLTLVPNPALVEIDGGFNVLMYHGASMHGIIEELPEIRLKYGHNSPTRVAKEFLKRRHLSPMHGACDYIPTEKKDNLVIDIVPDILVTGDQHRPEISSYNNVLLIACSCWQSKTPFEEKVGNNPDPCKVPIFNLKTREIKILDFSDGEKKEEQNEVTK
jgi:DNA polymerase II small subunit